MKKFYYLIIAVASVMLVLYLPHSAVAKQKDKNILLIVADDMGIDAMRLYTDQLDLTPDQQEDVPPTPTIDSLAADGVTFNNAWSNPACSPTRGTLITGRYGFRTGITWVAGNNTGPSPDGELDVTDPELLPKVLKENGYATALIGKWHLTTYDSPIDPNTAGFDYWAGFLAGALIPPITAGYYDWQQIINGSVPVNQTTFATTENVNQAIGFIGDQEEAGNPWFVSLNFAAPHSPYQVPPKGLVNDGTPEGISVYNKVVAELGSYTPPGPHPLDLTKSQKRALFNALIYAMDKEIGRLLEAVDKDKTCIIFIGDNGTQGSIYPIFDVVVNPFPADKAKVTLYEGGIRIPMVVYDRGIKNPGRFTDALVSTVDIYAMILKIAGCPKPNRFDGKHFRAVLRSRKKNVSVRNYIFAEQTWQDLDGIMPPRSETAQEGYTIRNDRYKLIKLYVYNDGQVEVKFEFYNLLNDPFEESNLLEGDLTNKEKSNYKWLLKKLEKLLSSKK